MNRHWNSYLNRTLSRRELLRVSSAGFGALALAGLLGEQMQCGRTTAAGAPSPLAVKAPHFAPRAKRVIFLFMHGGPSQVDTFDYKPLLKRDHGKPLPFQRPKVVSSETFNLLKSPWEFKQYGQSGMWVSDLFPEFAKRVDDVCFIKSMWGSNSRHGGALLEMHTGSDTFVRPVHGLVDHLRAGQREPEHAGLHHHLPHAEPRRRQQLLLRHSCRRRTRARRSARWASRRRTRGFLTLRTPRRRKTFSAWNSTSRSASTASNSRRPDRTRRSRAASSRSNSPSGCSRKRRICRISRGESEATRKLYGLDDRVTEDFGRQCLMARRLSENAACASCR